MSDRLDLANYLEEHKGVYEYFVNSIDEDDLQIIIDALREKPRKIGKWSYPFYVDSVKYYTCPFCGVETKDYATQNYCSWCGARMEI